MGSMRLADIAIDTMDHSQRDQETYIETLGDLDRVVRAR